MTGNALLTISFLEADLNTYERQYQSWLEGEIENHQLKEAANLHLHWNSNGLGIVAELRKRAIESAEWSKIEREWERLVLVHCKALDNMEALNRINLHLGGDSISNIRSVYEQFRNDMSLNQIGMFKRILSMN